MEIEHVIFHPIHKNVGNLSKIGVHTSNCCLKSGLKNNWMKKLDRVNRPYDELYIELNDVKGANVCSIEINT